jgi:hypothetical protein
VGFIHQIGQLSQALKMPLGNVGDNHAAQYASAIAPYELHLTELVKNENH